MTDQSCEDHPDRPATHTLAGIAYLCAECAEQLDGRYHSEDGFTYRVFPIRKDQGSVCDAGEKE